jgi:hypothetical protein
MVLELLRGIPDGEPSETDIATVVSTSFDKCNNCQISVLYNYYRFLTIADNNVMESAEVFMFLLPSLFLLIKFRKLSVGPNSKIGVVVPVTKGVLGHLTSQLWRLPHC